MKKQMSLLLVVLAFVMSGDLSACRRASLRHRAKLGLEIDELARRVEELDAEVELVWERFIRDLRLNLCPEGSIQHAEYAVERTRLRVELCSERRVWLSKRAQRALEALNFSKNLKLLGRAKDAYREECMHRSMLKWRRLELEQANARALLAR